MTTDRHRRTAVAGFLACVLALVVARGSEAWLGLIPCAFCLLERWPYYIGASLGLLAALLPRAPGRAVLWLLALVTLGGAGLSFVHVGVEQRWWPDPLPECTAPNLAGLSTTQRIAAMPARPAKNCEDADFLIPGVPVSLTQMGCAYALAISAGLAISLAGNRRRPR